MRPYSFRFAKLIGRQDFDGAIDYLNDGLKGDGSDLDSLELIAHCHHWAGRTDDAVAACREALRCDQGAFDMHVILSQLLAEKGEYDEAAIHTRKGLESFPEPLPHLPGFVTTAFNCLGRFLPRLRGDAPNIALKRVEAERAEWFDWAKKYLSWYEANTGAAVRPSEH